MSDTERDRALPRVTHYTLIRLLGSGNQADVYLARHTNTDDLVAIKLFHRSADWGCLRIVAEIGHPNIVGVRELGREDDRRFLAMEYVEGGNLGDRVKHHGPLNPLEALQFALGTARALRRLHVAGILHRDIKPQNLLIDAKGNVKLADFGLATRFEHQNVSDGPAGTPAFISPELWLGNVATMQSDVYSLGATLLFLLTGEGPFSAKDVEGYRNAHLNQEPVIPNTVPRPIVSLLTCCLLKDPDHRLKSANRLVGMLKQVLQVMTRQSSDALPVITDLITGGAVRNLIALEPDSEQIDTRTNTVQTDAMTAHVHLTRLLDWGENLVLFHGSFRHVQDRILRNTLAGARDRYQVVARARIEGDSLAKALRARLDLSSESPGQLSDALISRCKAMVEASPVREAVVCVQVVNRLGRLDFATILSLALRLSNSNVRLVLICDTADAMEVLTRLPDRVQNCPSMLELIPQDPAALPKYIALETDYRSYGEIRWTVDALDYVVHLTATTKMPLDLILNNVARITEAASARLVTTWFVLAASAHEKWLHSPEQIGSKWREPPVSWPSEKFLGILREVRERSTPQSSKTDPLLSLTLQ